MRHLIVLTTRVCMICFENWEAGFEAHVLSCRSVATKGNDRLTGQGKFFIEARGEWWED